MEWTVILKTMNRVFIGIDTIIIRIKCLNIVFNRANSCSEIFGFIVSVKLIYTYL